MAGKERNAAGEHADNKEEFPVGGDSTAHSPHSRITARTRHSSQAQSAKVIPMPRKTKSQNGGMETGSPTASAAAAAPSSPAIKRQRAVISDQIGRQLRGMYDDLLNQSVPDRFVDLISQLEQGTFAPGAGQSHMKSADGKDAK